MNTATGGRGETHGQAAGHDVVYYDGACGLCHAAVRFALARDPDGSRFRFAPLGGAAWRAAWPGEADAPPPTLVVHTCDGRRLVRSSAVLRLARRLGWGWRVVAGVSWLVPLPLRDLVYRGVARVRRRLFAAPTQACPALEPTVRERFDLRP